MATQIVRPLPAPGGSHMRIWGAGADDFLTQLGDGSLSDQNDATGFRFSGTAHPNSFSLGGADANIIELVFPAFTMIGLTGITMRVRVASGFGAVGVNDFGGFSPPYFYCYLFNADFHEYMGNPGVTWNDEVSSSQWGSQPVSVLDDASAPLTSFTDQQPLGSPFYLGGDDAGKAASQALLVSAAQEGILCGIVSGGWAIGNEAGIEIADLYLTYDDGVTSTIAGSIGTGRTHFGKGRL